MYHYIISAAVIFSWANSQIYYLSETITRFPLLVSVDMYLTSSGVLLVWRSCTSGSYEIITYSVFVSWGCVYGADISTHISTFPLLFNGVVVVIFRLSIGESTGIVCFWYISVWRFSSCDTRSYLYQSSTTCLYRWPDCGWRKQVQYMRRWYIYSTSCTEMVNPVLVFLPSMVLHSSLYLLVGWSLVHFHLIGCFGSPVAVIIQSRKRFPYPVSMSNHNITCSPLLIWFNLVIDSWSRFYISVTLSIM